MEKHFPVYPVVLSNLQSGSRVVASLSVSRPKEGSAQAGNKRRQWKMLLQGAKPANETGHVSQPDDGRDASLVRRREARGALFIGYDALTLDFSLCKRREENKAHRQQRQASASSSIRTVRIGTERRGYSFSLSSTFFCVSRVVL